jgi:hypothetical protein
LDPSNADIFVQGFVGPNLTDSFDVIVDEHGGGRWHLQFWGPIGTTVAAGNTYPLGSRGATNAAIYLSGDHHCPIAQAGSVTFHGLTLDSQQRVTSLAMSLTADCEGNGVNDLSIEVRRNTSVGVAVTTPSPAGLDFGSQPVGELGPERTVTFTARGANDSVLGAASIPDGGSIFSISSDTCSNATLPYGQSCTIGIRAAAVSPHMQSGRLKLPINTGFGTTYVDLSLQGTDPRKLLVSPASLDFGTVVAGETSTARQVTVSATGTAPVTVGTATLGGQAASFVITSNACAGVTLAIGQSCIIGVAARPITTGWQGATLSIPSNNLTSPATVSMSVNGAASNSGTYYPLMPSRILDTRSGNGAPTGPAGQGATLHLQVAGRGGVPASGVSAVVLNVTVVTPSSSGHITVFPSGVARPTASSLNFTPGWVGANSVTVALGTNGQIDLYNSAGNTHLVADVVGFYALDNRVIPAHGAGGEFQPTLPERLFDSRFDFGEKLPAEHFVTIPVSYGEPWDFHIRALAVNVTAVDSAWAGYLTAFDGSGEIPVASTLNITPGAVVPNFAVVPTSLCLDCGPTAVPMIGIYTSTDVHVIVDVVGFYDDGVFAGGGDAGLRFTPQNPRRIVDSRVGQGMPGALSPGATASITPPADALPAATGGLAVNVTAVAPTADTFITVWPKGLARPPVSTLNPSRGQIVPNAAVALLGESNQFNLYNNAGSVHMVVDMVGAFYAQPGGAGPSLAFKQADARQELHATALGPQLQHR